MIIQCKTSQREYPIVLERGSLGRASEFIELRGRAFIVSESGVPEVWKETLGAQFPEAPVFIFEQGEANKNLSVYEELLCWLTDNKATREDFIIALGGGVTGDMAGFAAATYMRGINYVNIPTTSLSQLDSSIGGKTAVDLRGVKNTVGAFHQPSAVIIDPDTLSTLPERQLKSGLAEAVKAGLIGDEELFKLFESDNYMDEIDEIIRRSLMVKKEIVESDEREASQRKLLNLGHTYGHAYETYGKGKYLHGEAVAMGMMTVIENEEIRERLEAVLRRLGLPTECDADADADAIAEIIENDKKANSKGIDTAQVDEIGKAYIKTCSMEEIRSKLK